MGTHKKGNPLTTVNLPEEVEKGFDELGKLPSRLERYSKAHERALINLTQVHERLKTGDINPYTLHLEKVRDRMTNCGNYLGFRHYPSAGVVRLTAAQFCKAHLLCPLCAIRRGSKALETLLEKYDVVMGENPGLKMHMLTLTVKNGPDLAERYGHLKKGFQTLLNRRRDYLKRGRGKSEFAKVEGLIGSYETTNRGNGWHPHLHLMIFTRKRINAVAFRREWHEITGDSFVLRIDSAQHPDDPAQDFMEICKYALKFGDLTPEQNLEAYEVFHGKRLFVSAGLFWGVKIPEDLNDSIVDLDDLPYFELLYKYIAGSGYNLTFKGDL